MQHNQYTAVQASEVEVPLFTAILACLIAAELPSIDWLGIMQRQDLLAFLASHALPGHTELGVLRAVVRLVGVMCRPDTADMIARSELVRLHFCSFGQKSQRHCLLVCLNIIGNGLPCERHVQS